MWAKINDCGRQLNIGYKVRQTVKDGDVHLTEYRIRELDVDEYELELIFKSKNGVEVPVDPNEIIVLDCEKILHYGFEVWSEG
jgi:hypothetical protein